MRSTGRLVSRLSINKLGVHLGLSWTEAQTAIIVYGNWASQLVIVGFIYHHTKHLFHHSICLFQHGMIFCYKGWCEFHLYEVTGISNCWEDIRIPYPGLNESVFGPQNDHKLLNYHLRYSVVYVILKCESFGPLSETVPDYNYVFIAPPKTLCLQWLSSIEHKQEPIKLISHSLKCLNSAQVPPSGAIMKRLGKFDMNFMRSNHLMNWLNTRPCPSGIPGPV